MASSSMHKPDPSGHQTDTSGQIGRESGEKAPLESLRNDVRRYVEKRIEWLLLVLTEPVAFLGAKLLQMLLGVLLLAVAILMIWLGLAFAISNWVDSIVSGFLLSSIPLLLVSWWMLVNAPGYLRRRFQADILGSLLDHYGKEVAKSKRQREDRKA